MSESWVSSKTFSMLDCDSFMGRGRMSVPMVDMMKAFAAAVEVE